MPRSQWHFTTVAPGFLDSLLRVWPFHMDAFSLVTLLRVAASFFILCLPGMAIYSGATRLAGDKRAGFPQTLLFGIGLSIAFWPLLLLYLTLAGLSLGVVGVWIVLAISTALLVF